MEKAKPIKQAKTQSIMGRKAVTRRVEEALRESEARFRTLSESALTGVYIIQENELIYVNPALAKMFGYEPGELIGADPLAFVHPADRALVVENMRRRLTGNGATTMTYRGICKNGEIRDIMVFGARATFNERLAVIGNIMDIIERKRVEEALCLSQANLTGLIENTDARIWAVDSQYCLITANSFYRRQIQLAMGKECKDGECVLNEKFPPEVLDEWRGYYDRALRGESFTVEMQTCFTHPMRQIEYRFNPIRTLDGQVTGVTIIEHDVTARKQAEEALRESQAMLAATLNALPDLLFEVDAEGRFYDFRAPSMEELFISPADFLGKTIHEVLPPNAAHTIAQAIDEAAETGRHTGATYILPMPNGAHWFELSIAVKNVESAKRFIVLARNITERKQAETDLLQANKALMKLHEMLREQATRDALTGLHNRRYLYETIERELARAKREGYPISVVMIDIDHFKEFNDKHGHQAGDEILVALGNLLQNSIRQGDVACRYGGEEFIFVMPGAQMEDALRRAEAICRDFENLQIEFNEGWLSSTVSVGVALYPDHGGDANHVIKAADLALYQAKSDGRNCVRSAF